MLYSTKSQTAKLHRLLPLVLVVFCLIFSCNKKEEGDNGDYSEQFKQFNTELNKPKHHVTLEQEQIFIDSNFRAIKNPYTNDIFRYYGFKYLYYKKN